MPRPTDGVDTIRNNEIMEMVKIIRSDEYRCSRLTPLYDAASSRQWEEKRASSQSWS
jgi:hypothetical protein